MSLPQPIFCGRCRGYIRTGIVPSLEFHPHIEDCVEAISERVGRLEEARREEPDGHVD